MYKNNLKLCRDVGLALEVGCSPQLSATFLERRCHVLMALGGREEEAAGAAEEAAEALKQSGEMKLLKQRLSKQDGKQL